MFLHMSERLSRLHLSGLLGRERAPAVARGLFDPDHRRTTTSGNLGNASADEDIGVAESENQRRRCACECVSPYSKFHPNSESPNCVANFRFEGNLCSRNLSWIIETLIALAIERAAPNNKQGKT